MAAELKLIAAAIGPPGASPDWAAVVEQRNSKAESEPAAIALLQTIWQQVAPQLAELVAAMGIRQGRREDVLQDVWLTAFQKFPADCDADGLRRWLVRVAVNRCPFGTTPRGPLASRLAKFGRAVFGPRGIGDIARSRRERRATARAASAQTARAGDAVAIDPAIFFGIRFDGNWKNFGHARFNGPRPAARSAPPLGRRTETRGF